MCDNVTENAAARLLHCLFCRLAPILCHLFLRDVRCLCVAGPRHVLWELLGNRRLRQSEELTHDLQQMPLEFGCIGPDAGSGTLTPRGSQAYLGERRIREMDVSAGMLDSGCIYHRFCLECVAGVFEQIRQDQVSFASYKLLYRQKGNLCNSRDVVAHIFWPDSYQNVVHCLAPRREMLPLRDQCSRGDFVFLCARYRLTDPRNNCALHLDKANRV